MKPFHTNDIVFVNSNNVKTAINRKDCPMNGKKVSLPVGTVLKIEIIDEKNNTCEVSFRDKKINGNFRLKNFKHFEKIKNNIEQGSLSLKKCEKLWKFCLFLYGLVLIVLFVGGLSISDEAIIFCVVCLCINVLFEIFYPLSKIVALLQGYNYYYK